ncbi:hypothetical protein AYI70_g3797 [Smittium culicis]|uniref:Uncharacterized protein n=1 Tax=Smittium culicis TaxID=133412 RepID=A0A1R1Y1Y7_9FUNG|nr:hypothetical protein AYI70_g3797 [Smittium culicis]
MEGVGETEFTRVNEVEFSNEQNKMVETGVEHCFEAINAQQFKVVMVDVGIHTQQPAAGRVAIRLRIRSTTTTAITVSVTAAAAFTVSVAAIGHARSRLIPAAPKHGAARELALIVNKQIDPHHQIMDVLVCGHPRWHQVLVAIVPQVLIPKMNKKTEKKNYKLARSSIY